MDVREQRAVLRRLEQIEAELTFPKLTGGQRLALYRERSMLEAKLLFDAAKPKARSAAPPS
jgi:hypothetical protein